MSLDQDPSPIRRLEQKVDTLTWLVGIQTAIITALALFYLLTVSRYLIYFLIIGVPLLYVFRRWRPQLTRVFSSWWFRKNRGPLDARQRSS